MRNSGRCGGGLVAEAEGLRGNCVHGSAADPGEEKTEYFGEKGPRGRGRGCGEGFAAAGVGTQSGLSLSWLDAFLPLLSPRAAFPLAGQQRRGPRSISGKAQARPSVAHLPDPAYSKRGFVLRRCRFLCRSKQWADSMAPIYLH